MLCLIIVWKYREEPKDFNGRQRIAQQMTDRKVVVLIAGPTGVGKTELTLKLAERLGTEVVNADSMQIYRYMDIGTAKPTREERDRIRHHLLDIVDPDEAFDAARYLEAASPVIAALHEQQRIPLVVGGTGLYMKVLTRGICPGAPADRTVREQLMIEEQGRGLGQLHEELSRVDPLLGDKIHPNDRQRILRALEVFRMTGTPLSYWHRQHRFETSRYRPVKIFLNRDREELYARIDQRVLIMVKQGFLDEVQMLLDMGYGPELKSMQSLGYKQLSEHLSGECSLETAVYRIQRETRRYAKRQMTWFRGDPEFRWLHAGDEAGISSLIDEAMQVSSGNP